MERLTRDRLARDTIGWRSDEIAVCKRRGAEVVVLEAAVLIEAEWLDLVDEVWVISVKPAVARERLVSAQQADRGCRHRRASIPSSRTASVRSTRTVKIDNSRELEQFQRRVNTQWKKLQKRVAAPAGGRK